MTLGIPNTQLDIWQNPGAGVGSRDTYATIRRALQADNPAYAGRETSIFLQGSYGNDTNIYGESDVDVVIRLDSTFYRDISGLPPDQQAAYSASFGNAEYTLETFKQDVNDHLIDAFGADAHGGNKAIKIAARGNRRSADVLPAAEFRRYTRFISHDNYRFVRGICFLDAAGTRIMNYPKHHSDNCTAKHQNTSNRFKPVVRIFKNMRTRLVDDRQIARGVAPSYYIEGLIYNVPDDLFVASNNQTIYNCLNWLHNADRSLCVLANEQDKLVGTKPNVQWAADDCDQFVRQAIDLWNHW